MAETILAAVKTAPSQTEYREFALPEIDDESALMKVEVAGICGSDVKNYKNTIKNVIMGHENVGVIWKAGKKWLQRKGLKEGDRVFLEHYLPCMKCEWCHQGEYRHCTATDWHHNPGRDSLRLHLGRHRAAPLGRFREVPLPAVERRAAQGSRQREPRARRHRHADVQRRAVDAVRSRDRLRDARSSSKAPDSRGSAKSSPPNRPAPIWSSSRGRRKDKARLEVAKSFGADVVIDVQTQDIQEEIRKATGGKGVDVSIDCTAGAGTNALHTGLAALKPKAGILVIQGNEMKTFPDFPIEDITLKYVTIKSARGHSYKACELAMKQLASHRFPIEKALTHNYSLDQVDLAIRSVGGTGDKDVIHVNVQPWKVEAGKN